MKTLSSTLETVAIVLLFTLNTSTSLAKKPKLVLERELNHSKNQYARAVYSPDGTTLAVHSHDHKHVDRRIVVWDAASGRKVAAYGKQKTTPRFAFSPNGERIVTGSLDRNLTSWSVATGKADWSVDLKGVIPLFIVFSPDGKNVVAGRGKPQVRRASDGKLLRSFDTGKYDTVTSMRFSPNGKLLAACLHDGEVVVWEFATGKRVRTIKAHDHYLWCLDFSPDGTTFATASQDETVKLWETKTGRLIRTLSGHKIFVDHVAFHPSGAWLASGDRLGTVKLWDAKSGRELFSMEANQHGIQGLSFTADGKRLATSSDTSTIRIWHIEHVK